MAEFTAPTDVFMLDGDNGATLGATKWDTGHVLVSVSAAGDSLPEILSRTFELQADEVKKLIKFLQGES